MFKSLSFKLSLHLVIVMSMVLFLAGYMHAQHVMLPVTLGVIMMLILTLSTLFVQVYISQPVSKMTQAMRQLERGESNTRLQVNGSREIHGLSDSFNLMAERIFTLMDETTRHQVTVMQAQESMKHHEALVDLNIELASRLSMIERLLVQREQAFMGAISALVSTVEANDPYTHGHSDRVTRYSMMLAERIGLPKERQRILEKAGLLHDIGKIGVDKTILHKQGKLDDSEMAAMRKHPEIGMAILRHIDNLDDVRKCVGQHHERYDGAGYPLGLGGGDLLLEARILAVVDTFDAMTSDRPYRKGLPVEVALRELQDNAGTQFDPMVVEAFFGIVTDEWSNGSSNFSPAAGFSQSLNLLSADKSPLFA